MNNPRISAAISHEPALEDPFESLIGLKVALFTGNYNYVKEGANQALNLLVRHLERRVGATVRVYSPVTDTPAFPPQGTLIPVRSVPLPGRPEFRLALGLPAAVRKDIEAFAPDLIHVATPDILNTRALSFARQRRIPTIASVHTRFETYCDYYGLGFLRPIVEHHLNRFYDRSDMILATTPAIVEEMAARHARQKLRVWGRGVDADVFNPAHRSEAWRAAHGVRPGDVALSFFGRVVREKGIDRFAETVTALRAKGLPVRAIIIGEGPDRARLQTMLPDAICTGHLAGLPLATAIASTDILINPSLTETFGNVTLEAMASGVAVVAADAPSTHNLATDGAILVCRDETDAYVAAAERLVTDATLRWDIGKAVRNAALAWDWDHVLDAVLRAYMDLLGGRKLAGMLREA